MKRMAMALLILSVCWAALADGDVPLLRQSETRNVRLTMCVGTDRVLVRETCGMFLPAGTTEVRFQWTDADIDANSVNLEAVGEATIGGLRRPLGTTNTFAWPVGVKEAGMYEFVASYSVKSIKWSPTYVLVFDPDAGTATLTGKLHLTNSGKLPLRDAHIQVCVGPTGVLDKLERAETGEPLGSYAVMREVSLRPGWQRRVRFMQAKGLSAKLVYRAEPEAHKTTIYKYLQVDMSNLPMPGPLPGGHLEIYESVAGKSIPVLATNLSQSTTGATEIRLRSEPDIIFERKTLKRTKTDVEFDRIGRVSGYDTSEEISAVFRNRLPNTVRLELIERVPGKWEFSAREAPTVKEANAVRWNFDLEPNARQEFVFSIVRHTGTRAD